LSEETQASSTTARLIFAQAVVHRLCLDTARTRDLKKKTGATVWQASQNLAESGERLVVVRGSSGEVAEAIAMLVEVAFKIGDNFHYVPGRDYEEFGIGVGWTMKNGFHGIALGSIVDSCGEPDSTAFWGTTVDQRA